MTVSTSLLPPRGARFAFLGMALLLAGSIGDAGWAAPAKAAPSAPDFSGVWVLDASLQPVRTAVRPGPNGLARGWKALGGGKAKGVTPPPLRTAIYAQIKTEQKLELAGRARDPRDAACKPQGVVDLLLSRPKLSIFQRPNELVVLAEGERSLARHIFIGHDHPPADELTPSVMGHATARWQGADLIVDTVGIEPAAFLVSADYIPQSSKIHLVERLRLQDPATLVDTLTITDPDVLTKAWTIQLTYRKQPLGTPFADLACDPQRRAQNGR